MERIDIEEAQQVGGGLAIQWGCSFVSLGGAIALAGAGNAFTAVGGTIALGAAALMCMSTLGGSSGDYSVGDWDYVSGA